MLVSKDLTELVEMSPQRVDGVKTPASGFPFLVIKAVNAQGGIDEKPDIDGAEHVLQLLAKLIQAEAAEMAVGQWDEVYDIQLLAECSQLMQCFKRREQYGDEDDGESIMKDAGFPALAEIESTATYVLKRKISAAERKRLASEGKALPDGSYPIENAEDLHNAAVLARSGHGDVAAAKRLIAKRAKELGVPNPLADHASKEAELSNTETPTTEPTPDAPAEKSAEDVMAEAVAKAVQPLEETIKGLRDEMAALKATPIPGGPVVTSAVAKSAPQDADKAAQISRFERLAKSTQDRELARYYAERLAELKGSAA